MEKDFDLKNYGIEDVSLYNTYDESHLGCSIDNAFVIKEEFDYIPHEYMIASALFDLNDVESYDFDSQGLEMQDGKSFDKLVYKVVRNGVTAYETYWFDITAGFNGLLKMFKS